MMTFDQPYALESERERKRRNHWIVFPHIKPLADYVDVIRAERGLSYHIPHFDPCDGGVNAKVLFLLEAPGPRAVETGFVSRNNPDQTARNLNEVTAQAGLHRTACLMWNVVPWYVGDDDRSNIRPVDDKDIEEALPYLRVLLGMLPQLKVVVLMGQKAQQVEQDVRSCTGAEVICTHHTSPLVFNTSPEMKSHVEETVRWVAKLVAMN